MARKSETYSSGNGSGERIRFKSIMIVVVILFVGLVPTVQADEPPTGSLGGYLELMDSEDMVAWTTAYPEKMNTGSPFTLSGGFSNRLDIPLLVNLEASVNSDEICTLKSFTTQSSGLDVRQHEYLLMPQGWQDGDFVPGISSTVDNLYSDLVNDDTITFSIDYVGDVPGRCEMAVAASVKAVDGVKVGLDDQVVSTLIKDPLPTSIDLGGFDVDCRTGMVLKNPPLLEQKVSSGNVDLEGTLGWVNRCKNNDWGTMSVEYRRVGDDWEDLEDAAAKISDPGLDTVYDRLDLNPGKYEFRMTGALFGHWFNIPCILAILGIIGTVAYALLTPEPITKALAVKVAIGLIIGGVGAGHYCRNMMDDHDDYKVKVTVKDENGLMAELPGLPRPNDILPDPNDHLPDSHEAVY